MDFPIQIPSAGKNINEELREAILGLKRERAKELLADGADINYAVNKDRDTMLHEASTPYQVYCILGHGADVNTCNIHGKTPLHAAAETGKCVEVIAALISHCADVNARDKCGNLPLSYAVTRIEKDYRAIKELVMKGSLVMQHRNAFDLNYLTARTPLKDAVLMDDLKCVRALIKYHVLQRLPVAPDPNAFVEYCRHRRYNSMRYFYNKCCLQQHQMEVEVVHKETCTTLLKVIEGCFSLDDVVGKEKKAIDSFANRCLWLVRSLKYSIYNDVILSKLEELLDHRCIMNQVRELEIYTCVDLVKNASPGGDKKNSDGRNNHNKVIINADQPKSLGYLDKRPSSSSDPRKWEMESHRRTLLNPDFQLKVGAHKKPCATYNSFQNGCDISVDFQHQDISIWHNKIVDHTEILNEGLNLNDAYDIGEKFNEDVDQPQKDILREKLDNSPDLRYENLNLNDVYDIGARFNENVDQPQKNILNKKYNQDNSRDLRYGNLNLNDAYDINAEFNENFDPPPKDTLNKNHNRDNSLDLMEGVEKIAESQNVKSVDNEEEEPFKRVVLNGDLVATIAGYLCKRDLFNLFVAYYVPEDIPEEDEEEGSMDWWRKRIFKRVAEWPSSYPHKVTKFC